MKWFNCIFLTFIFVALGCERGLVRENPANTPQNNFDILWKTLDERYPFFELKNLNWDSVYQVYAPQVTNQMQDTALFALMADMLFTLRDGHVNLSSEFDLSRNWQWYLDYPENFNYSIIERNYLGDNYKIAGGMRYTILPGNIGYIYYGSFSSSLNTDNLDFVFTFLSQTRGLIFDIRNNGGGSLNNAYRIAERLRPGDAKSWLRIYKNGPGKQDFTPPTQLELNGNNNLKGYNGRVVLLTNRKTYSAANTLAGILYDNPNCLQLGDRTGGGGGIPADFQLPNGWVLRFSGSRDITNSGLDFEQGIPPTHPLDLDTAALAQGRDNLIESAKDLF